MACSLEEVVAGEDLVPQGQHRKGRDEPCNPLPDTRIAWGNRGATAAIALAAAANVIATTANALATAANALATTANVIAATANVIATAAITLATAANALATTARAGATAASREAQIRYSAAETGVAEGDVTAICSKGFSSLQP